MNPLVSEASHGKGARVIRAGSPVGKHVGQISAIPVILTGGHFDRSVAAYAAWLKAKRQCATGLGYMRERGEAAIGRPKPRSERVNKATRASEEQHDGS